MDGKLSFGDGGCVTGHRPDTRVLIFFLPRCVNSDKARLSSHVSRNLYDEIIDEELYCMVGT